MKRNLFFIICLIISVAAEAQLVIGKSSGQLVTEKAINGSVVVVKQSYQVKHKKTKKVYGRGGRKDFGHSFSIAVKTESGLILTERGLKPWLFDESFKKVEKDYDPVISLTEILELNSEGKHNLVQCPMRIQSQQPVEGIWIATIADSLNTNRLKIDNETGVKDGWLIWFSAPNDINANESVNIAMQSINNKVEVNDRDTGIDVDEPTNKKNILGGIYVCPHFLGGGHVAYKFVGIVVRVEDRWKIQTPFIGYAVEESSVSQDQQSNLENQSEETAQKGDSEDIDLTPVDESKDKKKEKKSKGKKQ